METLTATTAATTVRLEAACSSGLQLCAEAGWKLHRQLNRERYRWPMSVLPLEPAPVDYFATLRTARKRATSAEAAGYRVEVIERADYAADVLAVNRSMPERQGRPMDAAYLAAQDFEVVGPPLCRRHRVTQYGVLGKHGRLVAYAVIHRAGELALVSQILGHGDHLEDGIVQLLFAGVYMDEHPDGGWLVYNRHDSGTPGLMQAKEWQRFAPTRVAWTL